MTLPAVVDARALVSRSIHMAAAANPVLRSREWRPEEFAFLERNLGRMSEFEISQHLPGRSQIAVHIMRERSNLPASTKTPGWKTANKWRGPLGIPDQRTIIGWVERDLVDGRVTEAQGGRRICMISEAAMRAFVLNPQNWVYFNPDQVRDAELKRMIKKQRRRWGDEWLTNRQAADLLTVRWGRPVDPKDVLRFIKLGRLDGKHLVNKDGRQEVNEIPGWSYWMVLRSQVETLEFQGNGVALSSWTEAADAFLVLAKAVGLSTLRIGRLMNKSHSLIEQRWNRLWELGKVEELARQWGPDVKVAVRSVAADWRCFRQHFPYLERAARRYKDGSPQEDDLHLLTTVLRAQAYAEGKDVGVKRNGLAKCVARIAQSLQDQGLQPYL
jgi:hypothetical protein